MVDPFGITSQATHALNWLDTMDPDSPNVVLALDALTAVPGKPVHRVVFFLDEFGQLGRMDRLADSVTLLRGYGARLWLFVQDLSQLKAVYPRWQSFLANTSQQFFGTADFDTARYLSGALGQAPKYPQSLVIHRLKFKFF